MKQKLNGVSIIRVSTEAQAGEDRGGIPAQKAAIDQIAAQHGISILHEFVLTESGARVLENAQYRQFLKACEPPDITCVVTKEFSRIMRPDRLDESGHILQHLIDNGITLYMPDAVLNLSNSGDWFMTMIKAAVAGNERNEIKRRMMDGKEALRRGGRHPSGRHTLARGIACDKKGVWSHTPEIQTVKLLFKLWREGEQNYARLSELTGIARTSVREVLTNPVYSGVMVYDQKHDLSAAGAYLRKEGSRVYRRKIDRGENEIVKVQLPAHMQIITPEEHQYIVDCVENLRRPRADARNSHQPRFTYRGYLRCGSCNDTVYTWTGTPKKLWYYCKQHSQREKDKRELSGAALTCCNQYMMRQKLEAQIDQALTKYLCDADFLHEKIRAYFANQNTSNDCQLIENEITKLEQKKERIKELFVDGDIDRTEKDSRIKDVDQRIQQLRRKLPARSAALADHSAAIQMIVSTFKEWAFLGMDVKRKLLEQLVPEIYVHAYQVKGISLRLANRNNDNHLRSAE